MKIKKIRIHVNFVAYGCKHEVTQRAVISRDSHSLSVCQSVSVCVRVMISRDSIQKRANHFDDH